MELSPYFKKNIQTLRNLRDACGKDIFGRFSDALPDRWWRTLLLRRFGRKKDVKHRHFVSAMTLLDFNDSDNTYTGHGYLDIVDFILQNCTNVEDNLQELYRRIAFNICIGNTDDHFRNHGFLPTAE